MIKTNYELKDILDLMSAKEINAMYQQIQESQGINCSRIKTIADKKDYIIYSIIEKFFIYALSLTKEEVEQLKSLMKGEKPAEISPRLIKHNFIIKINDHYLVPQEIASAIEQYDYKKNEATKLSLAINHYLQVNGALEIDKLMELLKATGLTITKPKLKKVLKIEEFIIDKDNVYLDKIAQDVSEMVNLIEYKKDYDYKIFTIAEMVAINMMTVTMLDEGEVHKILAKKIKDEEKLNYACEMILKFVTIGGNYDEVIEEYLEREKIKLNKKEKANFFEDIDAMYMMLPTWDRNGYSEFEIDEDLIEFEDEDDEDE